MLGSFIIGLVGTSNMLGITEHRAVGFLRADHVWQANIPFQTGGLLNGFEMFSRNGVCIFSRDRILLNDKVKKIMYAIRDKELMTCMYLAL